VDRRVRFARSPASPRLVDSQEPALGDVFLERLNDTIQRISDNPHQYQLTQLDLHRAPVRTFRSSVWYRVLPASSSVGSRA
jgi:hypothetical protein